LTNCFLVTASYDPNDKQVFPDGIIDTTVHWLTYTIRFQNTGTAAADNIYVIDTLSNDVDIQSFQLLAMSHPGFVQILENRIVRFNFPNINLPDSNSNEPLSHGYAQYKVKLNDNLPVGTSINNTAYIFFDFNPPVVTNTVNNTIDLPNGISAIATERPVTVFPVPFVNSFTLMGVKNSSFSIFDSFGKEILVGEMTNERMEINSESWPQGIYLIKVQNGRKLKTGKLIKK
jgi:hypothetical protein